MTRFSDEQRRQLDHEHASISGKYAALMSAFLDHSFRSALAKEFAIQGYIRRLRTITRCIDNVFLSIPPEIRGIPSDGAVSDATINLQSCMLNVYGCVDNLAWMWVYEKNLARPDGAAIPHSWVGLAPKNTFVRASFSDEFREHLIEFGDWFAALENYRHALAHRIPFYIPPFTIGHDHEDAYRDIEDMKSEALRKGNHAEYERLSDTERPLQIFRPWIMHSFSANASPIVFHPQILADFNSVVDLGQGLLDEMKR